jgi:DNA-binding NtrC family response regulator
MNERIFIISAEAHLRMPYVQCLHAEGYEVEWVDNYCQAIGSITTQYFDLIIADIMLGEEHGLDLLHQMRDMHLTCPVILITEARTVTMATEAVRLGAFDYLLKPVQNERLVQVTYRALHWKKTTEQHERRQALLEAVFGKSEDAIIAVNTELTVVDVNRAGRQFCGGVQVPIGQSIDRLINGCSARCVTALKNAMDREHRIEVQRFECQLGQQPTRVMSLTASPVFHPKRGVVSGAIMVLKEETSHLAAAPAAPLRLHRMIGKSTKMRHISCLIEKLADIPTPVLITGESGTGKELTAEAIHYSGKRKDKPLIKVNCAALAAGLLESELFGHVKGAFTGAIKDKAGRFQLANGGTILLDEIGDISPDIQQRLLRVLQDYEFERVGDSLPIKADVRVIAATNKCLLQKIQQGAFREDLYYRLKVMEITLPPLRERREDIPLLVEHCLAKLNSKLHKEIVAVSEDVLRIFMQHPWPGNVRQLEHALEHAVILCQHHVITVDCLPPECISVIPSLTVVDSQGIERQMIVQALQQTGWNKAKAARLLGMSRRTIYRKMQKYYVPCEEQPHHKCATSHMCHGTQVCHDT